MSARAKPEAVLAELEGAADRLGVKVSYEALHAAIGGGGLCRVKGQYRVILDKRTTASERVVALAHALGQVGVAGLELSAGAREALRHA